VENAYSTGDLLSSLKTKEKNAENLAQGHHHIEGNEPVRETQGLHNVPEQKKSAFGPHQEVPIKELLKKKKDE
jgi:hypothetical protein